MLSACPFALNQMCFCTDSCLLHQLGKWHLRLTVKVHSRLFCFPNTINILLSAPWGAHSWTVELWKKIFVHILCKTNMHIRHTAVLVTWNESSVCKGTATCRLLLHIRAIDIAKWLLLLQHLQLTVVKRWRHTQMTCLAEQKQHDRMWEVWASANIILLLLPSRSEHFDSCCSLYSRKSLLGCSCGLCRKAGCNDLHAAAALRLWSGCSLKHLDIRWIISSWHWHSTLQPAQSCCELSLWWAAFGQTDQAVYVQQSCAT